MADEILSLGADLQGAIRALGRLESAINAANNANINFAGSVARVNYSYDENGEAIKNVTSKLKGLTSDGRQVKAVFTSSADGIKLFSAELSKATKNQATFRKESEQALVLSLKNAEALAKGQVFKPKVEFVPPDITPIIQESFALEEGPIPTAQLIKYANELDKIGVTKKDIAAISRAYDQDDISGLNERTALIAKYSEALELTTAQLKQGIKGSFLDVSGLETIPQFDAGTLSPLISQFNELRLNQEQLKNVTDNYADQTLTNLIGKEKKALDLLNQMGLTVDQVKFLGQNFEQLGSTLTRLPTLESALGVKFRDTLAATPQQIQATDAALTKLTQTLQASKLSQSDLDSVTKAFVTRTLPQFSDKQEKALRLFNQSAISGSKLGLVIDAYAASLSKSSAQLPKLTGETRELFEALKATGLGQRQFSDVVKAYTSGVAPGFSTAQQRVLKDLTALREVLSSYGATIEQSIEKTARFAQVQKLLSGISGDPFGARAAQLDIAKTTGIGSVEEIKRAEAAQNALFNHLYKNTGIAKRGIEQTISAMASGITDKLTPAQRQLIPLITQWDLAYQNLGKTVRAAADSQRATVQRQISDLIKLRNTEEQNFEEAQKRARRTEGRVAAIFRAQPIADEVRLDPRFSSQISSYNSQLLTVVNQLTKTKLEGRDVADVFEVIGNKSAEGIARMVGEKGKLYSALETLEGSYSRLQKKVNDLRVAHDAEQAAAIRSARQQEVASARRAAVASLSAGIRGAFAPVEQLPSVDFKGRQAAIERYSQAQLKLDQILQKTGANVKVIDAAFAALGEGTDLTKLPTKVLTVRDALYEVVTAHNRIVTASSATTTAIIQNAERQRRALETAADIKVRGTKTPDPQLRADLLAAIQPTALPIDAGKSVAALEERINSVGLAFDKLSVKEENVLKVLYAIGDPSLIAGLTEEERRLYNAIQDVNKELNKITASANKQTAALSASADQALRMQTAQKIIGNLFTTGATTGVDPNKLTAFAKAQRDVVAQFTTGKATVSEFNSLLSTVGAKTELTAVEPRLKSLYESMVRLGKAAGALDKEFVTLGRSAVATVQEDAINRFRLLGGNIETVKEVIDRLKSSKGFTGLSKDAEIFGNSIEELIRLHKLHGKSSTEAFAEIDAAFNAEVAATQKRIADEQAAEAIADKKRKDRFDKRRTEQQKEIADQTAAISATRPIAETSFAFDIPKYAKPEDFIAIATGLNQVSAAAVRAGLDISKSQGDLATFNRILTEVKTNLSRPTGLNAFTPLPPKLEALRAAMLRTQQAFASIESPAVKAGKGILISWSGVFRLFQAQVLHTVLGDILGSMRQAISATSDFQKQIGLITTITQEQPDSFDQWASSITKVSDALGFSSVDVATAGYDALSNQVTKTREETEKFLFAAAELARVTGSNVTDSVNLLSSVFNSFDKNVTQVEDVSSKLFTTIDLGRVKIDEIAGSFGRTSSLATELGISFEEILAGLVTLTQLGVSSSESQTQLNNVFNKLLKPTEDFKKLLQELGYTSGEELVKLQGLGGALQTIAKAAQEGKVEISDVFNELRGRRGFGTLAANGLQQFNSALQDINASADKYDIAKEKIAAPPGVELAKQLEELKTFFTVDIGGAFAAAVVDITNRFGGMATAARGATDGMRVAFNATKDTVKALGVGIATALSVIVLNQFAVAIGVMTTTGVKGLVNLTLVTTNLKKAFASLYATILANPFVAIGVAAFAATSAFLTMKRAQEEVLRGLVKNSEEAFEAAKQYNIARADAANDYANKEAEAYISAINRVNVSAQDRLRQERVELNRSLSNWQDYATQLSRTMEVTFKGIVDVFEAGITNIKKQQDEAAQSQKQLSDALNSSIAQSEDKRFEGLIKAFPQFETALQFNRAEKSGQKATDLINQGNINAALDALTTMESSTSSIQDRLSNAAAVFNSRLDRSPIYAIAERLENLKPKPLTGLYQELEAATKAYQALESEGPTDAVESEFLRDQRKKALLEIESIEKRIAAARTPLPQVDNSQLIATQTQINVLKSRAAVLGYDEATAVRLIYQYELQRAQLIEQAFQVQQQREAEARAQGEALQAGLREIQSLYRDLASIKFFDEQGELLPQAALDKARSQFTVLAASLNQAMLQQAQRQAIVAPVTLDYEQLTAQIDQFYSQVDKVFQNQQKQIEIKTDISDIDTGILTIQKLGEDGARAINEITKGANDLRTEMAIAAAETKELYNYLQDLNRTKIDPGNILQDFNPFASYYTVNIGGERAARDKLNAEITALSEKLKGVELGNIVPDDAIADIERIRNEFEQVDKVRKSIANAKPILTSYGIPDLNNPDKLITYNELLDQLIEKITFYGKKAEQAAAQEKLLFGSGEYLRGGGTVPPGFEQTGRTSNLGASFVNPEGQEIIIQDEILKSRNQIQELIDKANESVIESKTPIKLNYSIQYDTIDQEGIRANVLNQVPKQIDVPIQLNMIPGGQENITPPLITIDELLRLPNKVNVPVNINVVPNAPPPLITKEQLLQLPDKIDAPINVVPDVNVIPPVITIDELLRLPNKVNVPVNINVVPNTPPPLITKEQLLQLPDKIDVPINVVPDVNVIPPVITIDELLQLPDTINAPIKLNLIPQEIGTINPSLALASSGFIQFASAAIGNINAVTASINRMNSALVSSSPSAPVAQAQPFARGGLVPVMLTPGELIFSPEFTARHRRQLELWNKPNYFAKGGLAKGTDTIFSALRPGSFVMNAKASRHLIDEDMIQYKRSGGAITTATTEYKAHFSGIRSEAAETEKFVSTVSADTTRVVTNITSSADKLNEYSDQLIEEMHRKEVEARRIFNQIKNYHVSPGDRLAWRLAKQSGRLNPFHHYAKGGLVKGTDTIPGLLPSGSFVMRAGAFPGKLNTFNTEHRTSTNNTEHRSTTNNNTPSINVTIQGGGTPENQAMSLGKAIARQMRLGNIKGF